MWLMNEVSWDVGWSRRCWKVEIIHHINYWEWMRWHHTPWSYFMSTVKISQAWNNILPQLQYLQVIQHPLFPPPLIALSFRSIALCFSARFWTLFEKYLWYKSQKRITEEKKVIWLQISNHGLIESKKKWGVIWFSSMASQLLL